VNGLLLPFAAALIVAVMTAAILTVHLRNGFFVTASGYEYNLVLIGIAFALAGAGGGSWSLDAALGLDLTGAAWALGALAVGIAGGAGAVFTGRRYGAHSGRGGHTPHAHPA
jgi:putative oxidoreductase